MYIEELKAGESDCGEDQTSGRKDEGFNSRRFIPSGTKRVLIGAGARALFYPTLLYNVVRNMMQAEFHWWDRVHQFVLLGAVPFPIDVPRLKELGVHGVITLNEPHETLVPTSLYHAHGIDHLVIPTRDYCFAPSLSDICKAVDFIHKNESSGQLTYIHCKAGRGRSTTIVLCYLVQHKQMTPEGAYLYVRSIRPRVRLASTQWQAVQEYYHLNVKIGGLHSTISDIILKTQPAASSQDIVAFDDGSVVVITEADLDGYNPYMGSGAMGSDIWTDLNMIYRVRVVSKAAITGISCLWLRCRTHQKISAEKLDTDTTGCSMSADCLGGISVDIHVY
ncbi:putative dual specificity protein phosphatase DSP8 [Tripterygium wilfordii]|uniref:phosphatidylglycerophosphatase n=1 Tax=Tripterygium wilfordii TaxID=458696 RepID=A0A7J7C6T3_TRIWF|nr:phosphatidylglycerophosphate phosphatase PTPMT1-like isoform X1 [Tripterygium wilfordii]KAF5729822.1 putative dual specificity protein phosphatase DSP8 [Tripterygium wilfordii]